MAKEFDVRLNHRLTECDIIVYSIPLRDGFTAFNRLILDSCIESYTLQKFIAAATGSELTARIDETLKTCYERLAPAAEIDVSADLKSAFSIYPETAAIELDADRIQMLASALIRAENALSIALAPIEFQTSLSSGRSEMPMEIETGFAGITKNSVLRIQAGPQIRAEIAGTRKQSFEAVHAGSELRADLGTLCNRVYNDAASLIQLSTSLLDASLNRSFGRADVPLEISADLGGNLNMQKFDQASAAVALFAEAAASLWSAAAPVEAAIGIGAEAAFTMGQYRRLKELDPDSLSAWDAVELQDADFIVYE